MATTTAAPPGPPPDADVLVVGAGPVGLTLAMCLARRGHAVTLVEARRRGDAPEPKCNHVAARSMEVFRRLGVADALRAAGLPDDWPHDVSYRTTTVGRELTRIHIPGRPTRLTDKSGPDGWWPTPEPPHRINQIFLEPILGAHAAAMPGIRLLDRTEALDLAQDAHGVRLQVRALDGGATSTLRARWLVGCDGGRSMVRRAIGARLSGDEVIQRVQSSFVRLPGLLAQLTAPKAWAMFSYNPRRSGNVYAIDGIDRFLVHNYLRDSEPDFESVDRMASLRTILGVGPRQEIELISKEDWYGRRLVADRFRDGRIFICGDAAHLWVPYAGYGMNAGIADADNLAGHLAAVLEGWGDPALLEAYVRERQPITQQVSHFVMDHAHAMTQRRRAVPPGLEDDGPQADALRAQVGRDLYELNVQQYCCAGLNFGYFYDASPLIVHDGEAAPGYTMGGFTPSSVPGCRLPHHHMPDGRSVLDALGPAYTLLRYDAGHDGLQLRLAAQRVGLPLAVVDVPREQRPAEVGHPLLLVRWDSHVAWRGGELGEAAARAVVARLRGRRMPPADAVGADAAPLVQPTHPTTPPA